jgi:hypothetical protein
MYIFIIHIKNNVYTEHISKKPVVTVNSYSAMLLSCLIVKLQKLILITYLNNEEEVKTWITPAQVLFFWCLSLNSAGTI